MVEDIPILTATNNKHKSSDVVLGLEGQVLGPGLGKQKVTLEYVATR